MDQLDCQFNSSQALPAARAQVRAARAGTIAYPPSAPDAQIRLYSGALRLLARLYTATCVRELSLRYQAPLPPGPKIIALNHANVTDALFLPSIFPDVICFLAQANLFDLPVIGRLLALSGHLPVIRGQSGAVLEAAERHLRRGYTIAVCPEGRLNHGGPLHRGRIGAVRLALQSGFPIVPVGFYVADRYTRVVHANVDGRATYGRWQLGGTCQVEIGRPWWPGQRTPGDADQPQPRRLTDELMRQIETLVRQAQARAEP